jgi:prepilin-type processing-associated H-X9-DG protein
MQYTQDYDEILPLASFTNGNNANGWKWVDAVYPYVKSIQAFQCPSTTNLNYSNLRLCGDAVNCPPPSGPGPYRTISGHNFYGTYGYNSTNYNAGDAYTSPNGQNLSAIKQTSQTIFAAEYMPSTLTTRSGVIQWGAPSTQAYIDDSVSPAVLKTPHNANATIMQMRHLGTANILFCDGHAKALNAGQLTETHTVGTTKVQYLWTIEED